MPFVCFHNTSYARHLSLFLTSTTLSSFHHVLFCRSPLLFHFTIRFPAFSITISPHYLNFILPTPILPPDVFPVSPRSFQFALRAHTLSRHYFHRYYRFIFHSILYSSSLFFLPALFNYFTIGFTPIPFFTSADIPFFRLFMLSFVCSMVPRLFSWSTRHHYFSPPILAPTFITTMIRRDARKRGGFATGFAYTTHTAFRSYAFGFIITTAVVARSILLSMFMPVAARPPRCFILLNIVFHR